MSALGDHITAILIELAKQNGSAKYSVFRSELRQKVFESYEINIPEEYLSEALTTLERMGASKRLESPLTGDLILLDPIDALEMLSDSRPPSEDTSYDYDLAWQKVRRDHSVLITYFHGGQQWINKVIENLRDFDFQNHDLGSADIPASDRLVSTHDNKGKVEEIRSGLAELAEHLAKDNDIGTLTPDERSIAIEEITRLRGYLDASKVRAANFLAGAQRSLKWIGEKAASATVGELAKQLLKLIFEWML